MAPTTGSDQGSVCPRGNGAMHGRIVAATLCATLVVGFQGALAVSEAGRGAAVVGGLTALALVGLTMGWLARTLVRAAAAPRAEALRAEAADAAAAPHDPAVRLVAAAREAGFPLALVELDGRSVATAPLRLGPLAHGEDRAREEIALPERRWLQVERRRLPDGAVVGLCADVTVIRRREARLAARIARLDEALDTMSQGLCLYDSERRLVLANRRYHEIYRLEPGSIRPGMTTVEVLGQNVLAGNHPGCTVAQLIEDIRLVFRSGSAGNEIQELHDGRVVAIAMQPTADGGFVATYEDVSERWHAEMRIAHMARHDALTNLPNRLLLRERIEGAVTQAGRDIGFAVHCLDLDNFKQVNDTLGHAVGDELLQAVAHRLRACLREVDTVARLGGDEFAIIQSGIEGARDASVLAQRILEVVSAPYELSEHSVTVGVSIGIALAPGDGLEPERLMKNADVALYRAKGDGRGVFRFFEPEMDARLQARRALEIDLRAAVAEEAFEVYYQPIYDVALSQICGFEALLRWTHPHRGAVSPADFIPLAEEIGLIVPLGAWVLRQACAQAVTWPSHLKVAVNVSAAQFTSAQLIETVRSALAESRLSPRRLELEITESVLLVNGHATVALLHALRGLGTRIAMDDFGTGYSSLSYLRSFPFDKMKIDQAFTRDLVVERGSGFIVRAVISLASSLGMTTTAEGVETPAQLARLREEGCDEAQGYLFSPPVPASAVPALIEKWNEAVRAVA